MKIGPQKCKLILINPYFMHDWVIGPNSIIFPIVCLAWKTNNTYIEYQI